MAPRRTVDDVCRPRVVMVTRTAGGALHLAVTGYEVTALAQREAVRGVLAQELRGFGLHEGHPVFVGAGVG